MEQRSQQAGGSVQLAVKYITANQELLPADFWRSALCEINVARRLKKDLQRLNLFLLLPTEEMFSPGDPQIGVQDD
ncbi:MAG: hypothetical protein PVF44_07750 [Syntrophobacterales bacterium]